VQPQLVSDLSRAHGCSEMSRVNQGQGGERDDCTIRQILLVGEDEQDGILHLPVANDSVKLLPGLVNTVPERMREV